MQEPRTKISAFFQIKLKRKVILGTLCEDIQAAVQPRFASLYGGGALEYFNVVLLTNSVRVRDKKEY